MSELDNIVSQYSSQSCIHTGLTAAWARRSVNPQPWRFTNNSLGLPHAHSFSVCLFSCVCVMCVWFLLYLSFYLCCERCVVCVWFCIHNHLFALFLLFLRIQYISFARCLVIRMTLLICLPSFSMYMFIILISAYLYLIQYTHFPPFPYPYTFVAIFTCILCVMFYTYTHVFVLSFFFRKLIDTCVMVSIDVIIFLLISYSSDSVCISTL